MRRLDKNLLAGRPEMKTRDETKRDGAGQKPTHEWCGGRRRRREKRMKNHGMKERRGKKDKHKRECWP